MLAPSDFTTYTKKTVRLIVNWLRSLHCDYQFLLTDHQFAAAEQTALSLEGVALQVFFCFHTSPGLQIRHYVSELDESNSIYMRLKNYEDLGDGNEQIPSSQSIYPSFSCEI